MRMRSIIIYKRTIMCMCVGPVSVILVVGTAVQCETVHGVMPAPRACKCY